MPQTVIATMGGQVPNMAAAALVQIAWTVVITEYVAVRANMHQTVIATMGGQVPNTAAAALVQTVWTVVVAAADGSVVQHKNLQAKI